MPSWPAAEWYRSPSVIGSADDDPVRRRVADQVAALAAAAKVPAPVRDARLDRAGDDICKGTPGDRNPSFDLVAYLLGYYGIVEPEPNLLFVRGGPHAEQAILDTMSSRVVSILRMTPRARLGVGVSRQGDDLAVVLAFQEQHLELRPVPRVLTPGLVAHLDGRVLPGHRFPKVIITGPGGGVTDARVREGSGRFSADLGCRRDQPGAYQVEIAADSDRGPAVLANFPIYCGVEPPARSPPIVFGPTAPQDAATAEQELLKLINKDRTARGLFPVRLDRRLSEVARAHSREMQQTGVVAHVSPTTGNAADRVKRARILPNMVAENVGRAYSAEQAERGFMSSPGHRSNVLEPRVTHVGVGIVAGAPEEGGSVPLYVTQLFTEGGL
jgi:uncharacterized protein YkwD